jgi:uncharacterized protein YeaO (DUF488 family)
MQISTGYFAKSRAYADAGYTLVSIAKVAPWFIPKDLTLFSLPDLAPTEEILALKDKPEEYEKRYRADILLHLQPKTIYHRLWNICSDTKSDKIVLLCYEAPGKFCHRHIVAKWLNYYLGCKVEEVALAPLEESSMFGDSDV